VTPGDEARGGRDWGRRDGDDLYPSKLGPISASFAHATLLAVVIGYIQWRTAHQRAVLDVFEKRFEIYQSARAAITEVITKGTVQHHADIDFLRATDKAQFLFGPEVTFYFNSVYNLLVEHGAAEDMMKSGNQQERQNAVTKKYAAFNEIANFYVKSLPLVTPYMRIHQKAPSTYFPRRNRVQW
jgi:hypothetical protein